jgi:hypothetical protein
MYSKAAGDNVQGLRAMSFAPKLIGDSPIVNKIDRRRLFFASLLSPRK